MKPWYVRRIEWELRGGWDNELRVVAHAKARLVVVSLVAVLLVGMAVGVTRAPQTTEERFSWLR